ncbi:MarR family transcriptional regulator [Clostridium sp. MCC353]|uniref:MarR family winged helix-turn-helix transcriptional regulator n=1 Tax=Clostridium sp. MCC353 TaxID=2592646 RepID=UPI001C03866F|nr:MarR family transcriptional regulator [Clostridium sp. MCC353]MBT9779614.1 MarR family transcriptional regulator [Clostridium sp. MCC353]
MKKVSKESNQLDQTFRILNERTNCVYQFAMLYNSYIMSEHNYGTGQKVTMIEAHILAYIEENPGTTITALARYWNRTKGAISQTVARLVDKGLVSRHKSAMNAKTVLLYPTEEGRKLSQAHKLYNTIDLSRTLNELLKECTMEEIDSFYKVLGSYIKLLK